MLGSNQAHRHSSGGNPRGRTTRYALAAAVFAAIALHTLHKLEQDLLAEMLWACHVASLLIGIGLLMATSQPTLAGNPTATSESMAGARPGQRVRGPQTAAPTAESAFSWCDSTGRRLVALGTLFHLAIGLPAYLLDALVSGTTPTSALVHTVPPLAGLLFLRHQPLPRWTLPSAAALYFALVPISRYVTCRELNVNLAFAPYEPVEPLLGSASASWIINGLLVVAALWAADAVLRKCGWPRQKLETRE